MRRTARLRSSGIPDGRIDVFTSNAGINVALKISRRYPNSGKLRVCTGKDIIDHKKNCQGVPAS